MIEPGGDLPKRTHPDQNSSSISRLLTPFLQRSQTLGSASYRFLSIAFADLRPAAFALVDLIALLTWCAAALLFRRTPGCSLFPAGISDCLLGGFGLTGGLPSHADAGRVAVREFDPRAFESELVCRQSFWDGFATKLKECLAHPFGLRPLW
jgi:hypothetical protein